MNSINFLSAIPPYMLTFVFSCGSVCSCSGVNGGAAGWLHSFFSKLIVVGCNPVNPHLRTTSLHA